MFFKFHNEVFLSEFKTLISMHAQMKLGSHTHLTGTLGAYRQAPWIEFNFHLKLLTGINSYCYSINMIINVSSHHIGSSSCDIFNDSGVFDSPDDDQETIRQLKAKLRKLEAMVKDAICSCCAHFCAIYTYR